MSDEPLQAYEPWDVRVGRELRIKGDDDNIYAGEWAQQLLRDTDRDELALGHFTDPVRGEFTPATIPYDTLRRHIAVFGVTGYGKSTLLRNVLHQHLQRGHGSFTVHFKAGDAHEFLQHVPEDRHDDVVYIRASDLDADVETSVGFNFFDIARDSDEGGYEVECQAVTDAIITTLKGGTSGWGATMDAVVRTVVMNLLQADEDYTPLDLYKILAYDDERDAFIEQFGDTGGDEVYFNRLAEYSDEVFDPMLRRLREVFDHEYARDLLSNENAKANIAELVEAGNIIVYESDAPNSVGVQTMLATLLTRRVWATLQARQRNEDGTRDPYAVWLDDFDLVARSGFEIDELLSEGTELNIGVCLSAQQLSQIDEDVRRTVYGMCDSVFAFNPRPESNDRAVHQLAQRYQVGAAQLQDLPIYTFLGRLYTNNARSKTDPFEIESFPPLPPTLTEDGLDGLQAESLDEWGCAKPEDELDAYGVLARSDD